MEISRTARRLDDEAAADGGSDAGVDAGWLSTARDAATATSIPTATPAHATFVFIIFPTTARLHPQSRQERRGAIIVRVHEQVDSRPESLLKATHYAARGSERAPARSRPTMRKNALVYLRIADAIRHDILSRGLPAHTRLPSEPALVRQHRAARATVRRALATLQDEGLIYSRQAVGTFVAEGRVEQDLDQLVSFTEFMVYRGIKPGSRVITAEIQRIDDRESALLHYLGLRPGAEVIHVRRLRLGGEQPLVIANTWLPAARFPHFLEQDIAHRSIYDLMEATGSRPTDAVQTIEATTLAPEEAALLTVPAGSAALLVRRVGYAKGVPVEYAIDQYRADRTTFRVRLGVLEKRLSDQIQHEHISV